MLKASRLPRRKDSGGAGTETSTVPFPYQTAKGGIIPRIWVAPRSIALSSQNTGTGAFFLRFFRGKAARSEKIPYYLSEKEHDYG